MDWVWVILGTAFVIAGLIDVFFTALHYGEFWFLSKRLYRVIWRVVFRITAPLPVESRAFGRSLGAPLMVVATIVVWVGLEIVGFAFLYAAGMNEANFVFATPPASEPGFREAFYLSGVSLATLGYGDIVPRHPVYRFLSFFQALIGFGIITLAISYVLNVYQIIQRLGVLFTQLNHQTGNTGNARMLLAALFSNGQPGASLDTYLEALDQRLVSYAESLRRYPIVFYFYSSRPNYSVAYAFQLIGEMTGVMRWAFPSSYPLTQNFWLHSLVAGIEDIAETIEEHFAAREAADPPDPVSFETFAAALRHPNSASDPWVAQFVESVYFTRDLIAKRELPDPQKAYERYRAWLPFAHAITDFVDALVTDLGCELTDFSEIPSSPMSSPQECSAAEEPR